MQFCILRRSPVKTRWKRDGERPAHPYMQAGVMGFCGAGRLIVSAAVAIL